MVQRYLRHSGSIQSAALAFYLLFTIFTILFFIRALLGLLQLNVAAILSAIGEFLPRDVVSLAEMYLIHVGSNPSPRLLLFGLFFSIYFPMRATNSLMRSVRTAYHLGTPHSPFRHRRMTVRKPRTAVLINQMQRRRIFVLAAPDHPLHAVSCPCGQPSGDEKYQHRKHNNSADTFIIHNHLE